ncbi:Transcription factor LHW [Sesamum angolense]|uniref:Transcription factor LHW n=1 Tax=Sesamum angolense TaxID=2727404 RepID=A0AAE1XAM9_9LAMI|nr:Transcription factor LHW [Sesamum angolense]
MGYLLKEALKTLCGVNQWSYAVFWKFGCQNPKLLIWEECYYGPPSCSGLPGISGNGNPKIAFQGYDASCVLAETLNLQPGIPAGDKVHLLVNEMMMDNHVKIVGEGLVGRVAFTGNHQWILSENYYKEAYPPEVQKEVCQQFSAGMQTIAVIPVLPHGVVQFGSCLTIVENMGFVNDVLSLVHQLGCVPGVLQSETYAANELAPTIGVPLRTAYSTPGELPLESNIMNASSLSADSFNYVGCSAHSSVFDSQMSYSLTGEIHDEMHPGAALQASNSSSSRFMPHGLHEEAKVARAVKSRTNQFMSRVVKAEVIPSNLDTWTNQNSSQQIPRPWSINSGSNEGFVGLPSVEANGLCKGAYMKPLSGTDSFSNGTRKTCENIISKHPTSSGLKNLNLTKTEASFSDSVDHLTTNSLLTYCSGTEHYHMNEKVAQSDLYPCEDKIEQNAIDAHDIPLNQDNEHLNVAELIPGFVGNYRQQKIDPVTNTNYDDSGARSQSGDDLFDILGADFKNKMLSHSWNSCLSNGPATSTHNWDKNSSACKTSLASSEIYSTSQGNSESVIFSSTGTDHLLDAVVSKVHPSAKQMLDDNVSCSTTLSNMDSLSAHKASLPYGQFGNSDHVDGELLGIPKYLAKAGAMSSFSLRTGSSKEHSGAYSQCSSVYDSWIENGHNMKQNNSASTGYSKKPNETSKTNRKRLKPGENPRPRPKDRQLIQDRVKELREIVPNGAKCSIDSLLERTIRHMLFLQSVAKHADKLKQTVESKIISKDGGLVLKDNFEGGATWAYEVGSQSMVCPIIVEDLNQPRQMLVEMLCEERGLFLEIADIIRGLGLTILKGLMETRNNKIWARFAVEANRDVTRMEIFLSLVRLLEQNETADVPQPNNISCDNMMVQHFHQAASVTATGRIHSSQQSS